MSLSAAPNLTLYSSSSSFVYPLCRCSSLTFSLTLTNLRSRSPLVYPPPLAFPSHSHLLSNNNEEEEEEQVIGDCLVFEENIFDDPFIQQPSVSTKLGLEIQPQNLVPEEWGQVLDEINLTKKEKRKIAHDMEFGQRLQNKKRPTNVNLEEYLKVRNQNISQLKPLVLDNPPPPPHNNNNNSYQDEDDEVKTTTYNMDSSRVEPINPRGAVYGRGLDDISHFFNTVDNSVRERERELGRHKLLTKEEKFLLNAKVPKLSLATCQKWLPLHTLAASGEFFLVNILLKHDVDINAADQDGLTALHKAIISKKQAITNYLLRESANPFVRDKDGASLMHYAVRTASSQTIKTLLLHNVDINLQDNDGWTPLHLAVQSRRTDVVRLLLMKGANKTLKNQDGLTPLELCLYSGREVKTYELIKLLKQLPRRHRQ